MVHLFDSLVRTIPDGVALTSIKQDNETLTLEGRSQSNARVSTYMRNLEGSGWMTNPELSIIEARGTDKGLPYEFKLQVTLANPNAPRDEDGDGIPDPVPATTVEAEATPATAPLTDAAPVTELPGDATPAESAPVDAEPTEGAPAGSVPVEPAPVEPTAAPAAGAAS